MICVSWQVPSATKWIRANGTVVVLLILILSAIYLAQCIVITVYKRGVYVIRIGVM